MMLALMLTDAGAILVVFLPMLVLVVVILLLVVFCAVATLILKPMATSIV